MNMIFENGKRKAVITETRHGITVFFYYDGYADKEWKKGSHGMACDVCKTLSQAKGKAKRYVQK
jgi:hypothetical protein